MWLRFFVLFFCCIVCSQNKKDKLIYEIISKISEDRLRDDIQTLVNFGTRHTLSDTVSETRGIGAARRWIKKEFEQISNDCYDYTIGVNPLARTSVTTNKWYFSYLKNNIDTILLDVEQPIKN